MRRFPCVSRLPGMGAVAFSCLLLANCTQTSTKLANGGVDPKYGVSASPRVIQPGQPVPKGGGRYSVGNPYVVAGKTYYPSENKRYRREGTASWYGDDFHGRLTANGEVYDMEGVSAAHPTLPMPSYARVTNLRNGRSLIVRVNDRGPFHDGREIDLSSKAAQLLEFHRRGTARVRVEYVGPAALEGSDDRKLIATLRDGAPAPASRSLFASSSPPPSAPVRRVAMAEPQERGASFRAEPARRAAANEPADPRLPIVVASAKPEPRTRAPSPVVQAETADDSDAVAPSAHDRRFAASSRQAPEPEEADAPPSAQGARLARAGGGGIASAPLPPPPAAEVGPANDFRGEGRFASRSQTGAIAPASRTGTEAGGRRVADARAPAARNGTSDSPRLMWQTGPAPARVSSQAAYAPAERNPASGRSLY